MTGDEIMRWAKQSADHSPLLQWMAATGVRGTDAETEQPATRVIAVRMPVEMVDRLDGLTAGSKDGRSGLIREAVRDMLQHIEREAA